MGAYFTSDAKIRGFGFSFPFSAQTLKIQKFIVFFFNHLLLLEHPLKHLAADGVPARPTSPGPLLPVLFTGSLYHHSNPQFVKAYNPCS